MAQVPAKLVPALPRPHRPHYALNIIAAALLAWGAAQCFVAGDGPIYSGWLVLAGWAMILIGWRTFAHRKEPVKSPAEHLVEGAQIVAVTALHFAVRVVAVLFGLLCIVGLLALAERFTF